MVRWFIRRRIAAFEKVLGVRSDYMRHMLDVSLRAFLKYIKIMPVAEYRRVLPVEAFYVGRLVTTRCEDCGTCVQIEVNLAKRAGVSTDILRTVLASRTEDLPEALADVYRFAEHVARGTGEEDEYRERIRRHYGEEALVELSITMAVCRVFPATKRAMGYAKSCALVTVDV